MKNSIYYFLLLISTSTVCSQSNQIPKGDYYSEDQGTGFYFIVKDNNAFQLSISQGKITNDSISNLELTKQKSPVFGVKYLEEDISKDSLTITFPIGFKKYHLDQIYLGTKNKPNDTPTYYKSSELNKTDLYEDKDLELKVDKTKYLLLLEETYNKDANILYEYELPKNVSKIEITYHPTKRREIKLHAIYDADNKTVTINEGGRENPLTFYKDFDKHLAEFKEPKSIIKDIIWTNEETIEPSTSSYNTPYIYKIKTFSSFDNALQTAKNDNKLLLTFFLPNGNQNEKNYETFIENYEQKLSDMMYDGYKADLDKFHFYLIPKKDEKLIKQLDLKENQLLVLDGNQSVIYRHEAPISELSAEIKDQISSYSRNDFQDMKLMKCLDDAVQSRSFDAIHTQRIFKDLTSITAMDFFSGHKSVTEKTYREKEYIENNIEYYVLQSNIEQVDQLFEKLIESHDADLTVDFQFADIVSKIQTSNYKGLLYKDYEIGNSKMQLKSIDYLIKFQKELENYKPVIDENYNNYYDFYNISYSISSYLNRIANTADENGLQNIKLSFKNLKTENNDYLSFLKKFIPEDYLTEYMNYYNTNKFHQVDNIVVRLDQMYEQTNSKKTWDVYKSQIANEANEAAWVVVEKITDKKFLKEALKWSKTSLDIKSENPYYLDTYAQLLYKNGDKKPAIERQTKAVDIISKDLKLYSTSLLKTTQDVLTRMKSGSY